MDQNNNSNELSNNSNGLSKNDHELSEYQKEILEGNRLIAKFMGGVWVESYSTFPNTEVWDIPGMNGYQFHLYYDSSWDWLMPVLNKIEGTFNHEGLRPRVTLDTRFVRIWVTIPSIMTRPAIFDTDPLYIPLLDGETTKLRAAWQAAVAFIKLANMENSEWIIK